MNKMSEDEVIEIVKDYLCKIHAKFCSVGAVGISSKEYYAIEILLDLYQKEKEKNKELENADLTIVYMNGFYEGENKWKDKIKAKIKELEEERDYWNFDEIRVLKKLLED